MLTALPAVIFAHGGVSKNVNNAIVFLNQNPLSPLVGEEVVFTFSITDKNFQPLRNLQVQVKMIDTFFDDPFQDRIAFEETYTTDANGAFEFKYTFEKENYFDADLVFADPVSGQENSTGFLVQTREAGNQAGSLFSAILLVVFLCALLYSYTMMKSRRTNGQNDSPTQAGEKTADSA